MKNTLITLIILIMFPTYANAYIGPGVGLGVLVSIIAVILAIIFLLIALVWFPIKRYLRKKTLEKADNKDDD